MNFDFAIRGHRNRILVVLTVGAVALGRPSGAQISEAFDRSIWVASFEQPFDLFGTTLASGDLNGDGFDDYAAFSFNRYEGLTSGGGLLIVAGGPSGAGSSTDVREGQSDDQFGRGLAFGDFDDDGLDEIAVGRPGRVVAAGAGAGDLGIFRSAPGFPPLWQELSTWSQATAGIAGAAEAGDSFAEVLAVGDFNGDGVDDLAIGVPEEAVGAVAGAGAVQVIYGAAGVGLVTTGNALFDASTAGVPDSPETDDRLGSALATGDVDCDGIDDLVVGVPHESVGAVAEAGAVLVLLGSPTGLTSAGSFLLEQEDLGGTSEAGDLFGRELAVGRMNGPFDFCATIWIGAPQEDVGEIFNAGGVYFSRGDEGGFWTQPDVGMSSSPAEYFGSALAVADFDGDGQNDVAIGAQGETTPENPHEGAVAIVTHGPDAGLDPLAAQVLFPRRGIAGYDAAFPGTALQFFGAALVAPDLDGNGTADLVVGAPRSESGANADRGHVAVFYSALFAEDFEGNDLAEWSSHPE